MVNKHQFCKTTIIHKRSTSNFLNVCLMWWERDKEREKEGWFCGTAHDGQWRREHVLLHQVAVLLWLRGLLYSAASAAIITQNKMRWWYVFAISQHTARLLLVEYVMNCTPADDFQLEQHMMQKLKRNHFNNFHWSIIDIWYYMQCEWYLNVELCIRWCIPSICAQDARVSGVL